LHKRQLNLNYCNVLKNALLISKTQMQSRHSTFLSPVKLGEKLGYHDILSVCDNIVEDLKKESTELNIFSFRSVTHPKEQRLEISRKLVTTSTK